mmetsp:Transcript_52670/g.113817  ORF Transcript_52670/g.113817 Transcript_52670/m.113817 type:complete len:159 (+) Transcript_52670:124-600(+)
MAATRLGVQESERLSHLLGAMRERSSAASSEVQRLQALGVRSSLARLTSAVSQEASRLEQLTQSFRNGDRDCTGWVATNSPQSTGGGELLVKQDSSPAICAGLVAAPPRESARGGEGPVKPVSNPGLWSVVGSSSLDKGSDRMAVESEWVVLDDPACG